MYTTLNSTQDERLCIITTGRQKVGGGRASHGATVNRRRRSRSPRLLLATRLLAHHPALLDDLCPRLAERVLNSSVHRWQFNAFLLDRLTGGRCLPTLCLHLLHKSGIENMTDRQT